MFRPPENLRRIEAERKALKRKENRRGLTSEDVQRSRRVEGMARKLVENGLDVGEANE